MKDNLHVVFPDKTEAAPENTQTRTCMGSGQPQRAEESKRPSTQVLRGRKGRKRKEKKPRRRRENVGVGVDGVCTLHPAGRRRRQSVQFLGALRDVVDDLDVSKTEDVFHVELLRGQQD